MAAHHMRQAQHSKRPQHARPTSKRTQSYGSKSSCKVQKEVESEDEDSMAVSFLNFCTVCEKQIVTPSNTVLYCSESCRKTDTAKCLTYPYEQYSPHLSPTTPFTSFANSSFEDLHFRDIVPQRSPTQPESKRSSCAFSDISSDDNTMTLDERSHHHDSDASRYLRQYQSSIYSSEAVRAPRPHYHRASASHINFSAAPSLSHTPTSMASFSLPYTPATIRPLPPRHNPYGSSYSSKTIDLVTPLTAPSSPKAYSHKSYAVSTTSTSTIEGEIVYAKSPVPSFSGANGSLGRLLASPPRA